MSIEALWAARIQDVYGNWQNGGIVVFESGRVFGGDSAYFYTGTFRLKDSHLVSDAAIENYAGVPMTVWGDTSRKFNIRVEGELGKDQIIGKLTRPDMPGITLNYVAVKKADLP